MLGFGWMGWGAVGVAVFLAWSFVTSFSGDYRAAIEENARLRHEASLTASREASHRRMIDRRDAAISASKCAVQIKRWVSHPDEIPSSGVNPFPAVPN